MDFNINAKLFKVLSDSKRLEILNILKNNELCACVLLEKLDLTQSGLSYHMKLLQDSGIVTSRQEGKWVYYKLSHDGINHLIDILKYYLK